jgi:hypothetical protein
MSSEIKNRQLRREAKKRLLRRWLLPRPKRPGSGKLRGPKYDLQQTQPAELRSILSGSDTKELARLVRKYGRKVVAAAARTVSLRAPGRPSRGLLPYYERMHLAEWIEEQAEEHRQAGSRKPYTDAEIDLYDLQFSGEEKPPDLQKWRRTIKKLRQQGRRELRELLQ